IARAAGAGTRLEHFTGEERSTRFLSWGDGRGDHRARGRRTGAPPEHRGGWGRGARRTRVARSAARDRRGDRRRRGVPERYVMTTYDPDTQTQDPRVLRRIVREFGGTMALDCAVEVGGAVCLGDLVVLL